MLDVYHPGTGEWSTLGPVPIADFVVLVEGYCEDPRPAVIAAMGDRVYIFEEEWDVVAAPGDSGVGWKILPRPPKSLDGLAMHRRGLVLLL